MKKHITYTVYTIILLLSAPASAADPGVEKAKKFFDKFIGLDVVTLALDQGAPSRMFVLPNGDTVMEYKRRNFSNRGPRIVCYKFVVSGKDIVKSWVTDGEEECPE